MTSPTIETFDAPFPHVVIENYLDRETIKTINAEWPAGWHKKHVATSYKWSRSRLTPALQQVVESVDLSMVERLTGIDGLFADPDLFGAGLHCIPLGGYLKMHVDFNAHPKGWKRRVNMLIYLNENWLPEWGGALQLGIENPRHYLPVAGRAVIFETTDESWHGHPEPLSCPADRQRRSLALYFYTPDDPGKAHSTIYKDAR